MINDTIPPTISCPGDLTALCDISEVPAYADFDAFLAAGADAGLDSATAVDFPTVAIGADEARAKIGLS